MKLVAFIILLILITIYLYYRKSLNGDSAEVPEPVQILTKNKKRGIKIELHDGPYSVDLLQSNPTCIYLHEDNEDHTGYMRRAHIRDEPNAHSIVTKHRQGSKDDDFYSDREADDTALEMIEDSFRDLIQRIAQEKPTSLIVPTDFGRENDLHKRAPNLYKFVLNQIFDLARRHDPISLEGDLGDWIRHSISLNTRSI